MNGTRQEKKRSFNQLLLLLVFRHIVHVKRDPYTYKKRPIYIQKETHIHTKRDPYTYKKRPIYIQKETYTCEKRSLPIQKEPLVFRYILHIRPNRIYFMKHEMRPMYMCQKRPIYVKRDLHTQMLKGMDMFHLKRDPYIRRETHIHTKRDPYMSKETYIHRCQMGWICLIWKETHIYKKRPIYIQKETRICQKRPTYTDVRGDGYVSFEKRPIHTKRDPYTYKKRPIYVKRDLHTQM